MYMYLGFLRKGVRALKEYSMLILKEEVTPETVY